MQGLDNGPNPSPHLAADSEYELRELLHVPESSAGTDAQAKSLGPWGISFLGLIKQTPGLEVSVQASVLGDSYSLRREPHAPQQPQTGPLGRQHRAPRPVNPQDLRLLSTCFPESPGCQASDKALHMPLALPQEG